VQQPQTIRDAQGRTVAVLYAGGDGVPYRFVSNPYSIKGMSKLTELISIPLTPDDKQKPARPALVRGQIIIAAQIVSFAGGMTAADIQVDGYIGSTPSTIFRTMLGGAAAGATVNPNTGQICRVNFEATDTFDKIAILARQYVDYVPSTISDPTVIQANVSVVAYMWSGG
jgi:hypothetical protein